MDVSLDAFKWLQRGDRRARWLACAKQQNNLHFLIDRREQAVVRGADVRAVVLFCERRKNKTAESEKTSLRATEADTDSEALFKILF